MDAVAQDAERVAVPGAHLRVGRHHAADARRGAQVQDRGHDVAQDHAEARSSPREVLVVGADEELLGSLRKCNELLDEVNKGSERVPGDEAPRVSAVLLPLQRRAAGDFVGDEGPAARAAFPQEGVRGDPPAGVPEEHGGHGDALRGGRDGDVRQLFNPKKAGGARREVAHRVRSRAARNRRGRVRESLRGVRDVEAHGLDGEVARPGRVVHRVAVLDRADGGGDHEGRRCRRTRRCAAISSWTSSRRSEGT